MIEASQWSVDREYREPMHRGPGNKLRTRTSLAGQKLRFDEFVQRRAA